MIFSHSFLRCLSLETDLLSQVVMLSSSIEPHVADIMPIDASQWKDERYLVIGGKTDHQGAKKMSTIENSVTEWENIARIQKLQIFQT